MGYLCWHLPRRHWPSELSKVLRMPPQHLQRPQNHLNYQYQYRLVMKRWAQMGITLGPC